MMEPRKLAAALLVLALVTGCAEERSKEDAIRELIELTGMTALAQQVAKQMVQVTVQESWKQLKKFYPRAPDHLRILIEEELNIAFGESIPVYIDAVIVIYSKYYTISEVNELVMFYKSDLGRKITRVTPELTAETMALGEKWGRHIVGPLAAERVRDKLRHEGYEL